MSKPLDQLWREIEASHKPQQTGWVRRLANPGAIVSVHAAVACLGGARSLMIDIPLMALGRLQDLPATGGLLVRLVPPLEGARPDQRSLMVELDDAQFTDVFTVFCADLVDGISRCAKIVDAIVLLLRRLERWQEFLSKSIDGLNHGEVIGLFGELWVLRDLFVPLCGIGMVESWTGAQRAPQDFVVPEVCAVEVKTSAARVLSHVRIHGERQLDDTGLACLFLVCLRLEPDSDGGESLNHIVGSLRELTKGAPEFLVLLDRLLTQAGWMERHARRYEQLRFRVAQRRFFRVDNRFPRLLMGALATGISEVEYKLDLKACSTCECDQGEFVKTLAGLKLRSNSRDDSH